jgi:type II secretory ATPase GspE/PulE/Tfp pilus assembly ATPase PilB-like protein
MAHALISRIKIMADMDIVERRRAQDGQITFTIDDRPVDVRVATIWGEKAVPRILDAEESLRTLGARRQSQPSPRACPAPPAWGRAPGAAATPAPAPRAA